MRRFKENFPILSRILIAILVLAILFLLAWGAWTLAYNQGWVQHAPTLNFASLANPVETREQQPNQPAVEPTAPPARVDPTAPPPREEPTAPPAQPTVPPATPEPIYTENIVYVTPEPEQPVQPVAITYSEETISFKVGKEKQKMNTFTYSGGWVPKKDPWFVAIMNSLDKEVPEAYGVSITGDLWPDKVQNFLIATCADPWSLTWFRFQLGLESFNNMDEANDRAWQLIEMKSEDYDKVVNETLTYFFKKLNGGSIETSEDWNLEVMLRFTPDTDDDEEDGIDPELFAREYSDTNHKPDLLVTFFAKGQKNTFVSNKKALEVAAAAAKVNSGNYSNRVWFNFTEGGTPKWKSNGKNNPPPGETNPPTSTPTPTTPPTPTPRPTKDPSQRPTESDAPVGGGPTNPENSTDPHTTDHVESTPAPAVTDPPPVTNPPTAVPTAEVRPTEVCETDAPTPIREDTNTPPPSSPGHNVPQTETEGQGGTEFDPGSI